MPALYHSQVMKQPIKPSQVHNIYLTKEEQLQENVDRLIKDLEASDAMREWWASTKFRALSKWNRHNRWGKALVHHYEANGHVWKTQRLV
jgi:hypothetical protein